MQFSIVNYKEIDASLFRLEAEFYNSKSLTKIDCFIGQEVIDFVQYGTSEELNEVGQGYPTLRLNEFESFFIKRPQKFCAKIDYETFKSLLLKKGDVLICRTNGNPKLVGKAAIVPRDYDYAFASYLFRIRPKKDKILPTALVTYLNSRIGRAEIEKYLMISNQANFSPAKFREILIPKLGDKIQSYIDSAVWDAFNKLKASQEHYESGQKILLANLGFTNWKSKHKLTFIKNFSDAEKAGRIDAEYFQPKYDEIVNAIKSYPGGWDALDNLVTLKDKIFNHKDKVEYKYIELSNIAANGEITECMVEEGQDLPSRARRKVATGDVIVSSIEGSLSSIALIEKEYDQALCSTGFHVINSKSLNSETLLVLLKSIVGQLQLKKGCSGTILTAINQDELKQIILPKVNTTIQNQIQQKITESFNLRKQSKHLLECAKRAVEIAIEQNEDTATEWLHEQTKEAEYIAVPDI